MKMRGKMTMIAKIYDSYYDSDTDPQLIVALTVFRVIVTYKDLGMLLFTENNNDIYIYNYECGESSPNPTNE
jgi:hypothetical protein